MAELEPQRFLGLRALLDLRGTPFDTSGVRPHLYTDSLWAFQLKELPGKRTRLVVSGYATGRPRYFKFIVDLMVWELAHWIMQTRQFANLKRRTEQRSTQ